MIFIIIKVEKRLIGKIVDVLDIELIELFLFVDILDIQFMVNDQNDKSFMRYCLLDMNDLDIEFLLDEDVFIKECEVFVLFWCKIFMFFSEEIDDLVENYSVRNLVEVFENKFKV